MEGEIAVKKGVIWISVSVVLVVITGAFYGGLSLGQVQTELHQHVILEHHAGVDQKFIPRTELETKLEVLDERLKIIDGRLSRIEQKLDE